MDPYRVLQVPRNAGKERIRKAYRARALETHPDRSGDAGAFQEVLLAFKVLSDDARRRRYDETGECDRGEPDNRRAEVAGVLAQALAQIVAQLASRGKKVVEEDLATLMREGIGNALEQFRKQKEEGTRTRDAAAAALGRFERADGDLLLEEVLAHAVRSAGGMLKRLEAAEEVHRDALKYLEGCTFRRDPGKDARPARTVGAWVSTAS